MIAQARLIAVAAALLALSIAGSAMAKAKRAVPSPTTQAEPTPISIEQLPRQFFAAKGVQPLTPELEQALAPKDSFKECDICPEMVVVPKGSFV